VAVGVGGDDRLDSLVEAFVHRGQQVCTLLHIGDVVELIGVDADHPERAFGRGQFRRGLQDSAPRATGGDVDHVHAAVVQTRRHRFGVVRFVVAAVGGAPRVARFDEVDEDGDVGIGGRRTLLEPGSERLDEPLRIGADVTDLARLRLERGGGADQERTLLMGELNGDDVVADR